jgi:hypothetical protein
MKLLIPHFGLLIWMIIWFIHFVMAVISIILLVQNKNLDSKNKLFFCLIIFFLPILGSILFLTTHKKYKPVSTDINFMHK